MANGNPLIYSDSLQQKASEVLQVCRKKHLKLATAESCTGGLIIGCLTNIAGSSDVIECAFVSYTNESKTELLGVPSLLLQKLGAVSEKTARAMAEGALSRTSADIVASCTGIAGPGGASLNKPVGLVHIAVARLGFSTMHARHTYGAIGRHSIRLASVRDALELTLKQLHN